jgi:hypothetical protein
MGEISNAAGKSCLCVVLGLFVWYGGRSGAAGADVLTTDVAAGSDAAATSQPRV